MKHLVIGILAHVDAGKTTLSEGILYNAGAIRKTGRVDHGDTFLDTFVLEKQRGITIFSKQAEFRLSEDITATLLDTPGHVDFSPEMERSLQVLDHAILIISQQEGVNGHVKTLWKLLKHYGIPVFIFVNKMDQAGADKEKILAEIRDELDDAAVDLSGDLESDSVQESLASADEILMEKYFSGEVLKTEDAARLVSERKIFPVYFGSALRMEGVDQILDALRSFAVIPSFPKEFGARVYKITRDQQGERLTWLKITGGTLKVKSIPEYHIPAENNAGGKKAGKNSNEKINQIRV
ncbi:MAG TPA: translation elongation factor G, partial [Lachnospiraceae bacterium]|nr:translation elongation factor G [Lachnospiraceae bacterium]